MRRGLGDETARGDTSGSSRFVTKPYDSSQQSAAQVQFLLIKQDLGAIGVEPVVVGHSEPQRQPIRGVDQVLVLDGMRAPIGSHPVIYAGQIRSRIMHGVGVRFRRGTASSPITIAERTERFAQPFRRRIETIIAEQPGVATGLTACPTGVIP